MYNLLDYGKMIADQGRTSAYLEALERALRPGDSVMDLGCGLGLFTLAACRLGAGRVVAVDTNPWIGLARELARNHGFEHRTEWHLGDASRLELARRVDLVISDLRGVLPPAGRHLVVIRDARERFLRPGGRLIPERDTVWATVVEAPELRDPFVRPFSADTFGFDLSPARRWSVHGWSRGRFSRQAMLTSPAVLWETNYATFTSPELSGNCCFEVSRPGTAHGIGAWFDTELIDGIGFSNAPWEEERVYGSAFFPWPEAVMVQAGDRIEVQLRASSVDEEYLWSWSGSVYRADRRLAHFQQSTFFGHPKLGSIEGPRVGVESSDDGRESP